MTKRGRHRLAASVLLAATGAACSGGAGTPSASRGSTTSTAPAARPRASRPGSTVTAPSQYDRVPPPPVVDRGRDLGAVADSLVKYGRWLYAHHPDPALIGAAYAPGSPPFVVVTREVTWLHRNRSRLVEIDGAPMRFFVVSAFPNVVSFRLTEELASRELIARDGRVVDHNAATTEHYRIGISRTAADKPWRLNLVEREPAKIEVQL